MVLSKLDTSDWVRERLYWDLSQNLSTLCPSHYEESPSLHPIDSASTEHSQESFRIDGPGGIFFEVEFKIFPRSDDTWDLHVAVDDGRTCHFTCRLSDDERDAHLVPEVGQAITSFLLNEIERRREDSSAEPPSSSKPPPHVPVLFLDEDGNIQDLSEGARRLLEYSPDAYIEPCFFSHVHGQNLKRVMRDLAHMVSRRKKRARWLLRLRTGNQRWRWYRALAENDLDPPDRSIRVVLRRL